MSHAPARPARGGLALALAVACAACAACAALALVTPATAQPWARFAVPDSVLPAALAATGGQYEAAWNALLVAELRATLARADSAARLLDLALRVSRAETAALGSTIAPDAIKLRSLWARDAWRRRVAAAVSESLGAAAENARAPDRADSLYRAALESYRALGERRREAWVLGSMGRNLFGAGRYTVADSVYRLALEARRALGDARMTGATQNALGSCAVRLDRWEEARGWYEQAVATRERTGERGPLSQSYMLLAQSETMVGRLGSADQHLDQALALAGAVGDSARVLEVLVGASHYLGRGGDLRWLAPVEGRGVPLAIARGDDRYLGTLLQNLGATRARLGEFTRASELVARSIALAESTGAADALAERLVQLGKVGILLQDTRQAAPPLRRALEIADSLGFPGTAADASNNLAIVARLELDASGAAALATRSLEAARAAGDSTRIRAAAVTLGELASDRGDFAEARRWFETAAAAGTNLGADLRLVDTMNLGTIERRVGDLDAAESRFKAALEGTRAEAPDLAWRVLLSLGDVAEARGQKSAALSWDRAAASAIDTLRLQQQEGAAVALLANRRYAFDALIHLLTKWDASAPDSGWAAEAFHWAERSRARSLLDLVSARSSGAPAHPMTIAEARGLLGSREEALLEYSVGDSSTTLWVVTRSGSRAFALPGRAALQGRVSLMRRGLASPDRAESKSTLSAAHALWETLVAPALPMLKNARRLVISPDGPLSLVPFEALLSREAAEGVSPGADAWLVSRWDVSYAFSAATLGARRAGPGKQPGGDDRSIVVIADPEFRGKLPPLPNTELELATLRTLAKERPFMGLTGAEATRAALLGLTELPTARLIHIATHGVANEVEPERSGLWLAPGAGSEEPGFVSVADIGAFHLAASLVTLSACETGLGRLERGEGVVGFTRAFIAAGARGVVVSLWKVSDRSSSLLMESFYGGLLGKHLARDAALARAKRELLKKPETRSPFHWAAFVLVGEAGALD